MIIALDIFKESFASTLAYIFEHIQCKYTYRIYKVVLETCSIKLASEGDSQLGDLNIHHIPRGQLGRQTDRQTLPRSNDSSYIYTHIFDVYSGKMPANRPAALALAWTLPWALLRSRACLYTITPALQGGYGGRPVCTTVHSLPLFCGLRGQI